MLRRYSLYYNKEQYTSEGAASITEVNTGSILWASVEPKGYFNGNGLCSVSECDRIME